MNRSVKGASINALVLYRTLTNKKLYFGLHSALKDSRKGIYVSDHYYKLMLTDLQLKNKDKLLDKTFKIFKKESLFKIPGVMNRKHVINVISHD
jgi:hypothetical protein